MRGVSAGGGCGVGAGGRRFQARTDQQQSLNCLVQRHVGSADDLVSGGEDRRRDDTEASVAVVDQPVTRMAAQT